ncbi:hypothetical protein E3O53_07935 [Cryobacterium sp. TMT2-18-3]|uniref:DUF6573 family protein n=1 Tax=Cryobacterium sp. TMT2-18-3 TaxID=1259250 RepID=UPI00106B12DD|nr:DUF6573 family protein [Cryobacterium sp. TMT2-18-3]TFC64399.1 hypothetical protein E3O53_07935 [Cryobacterium sp. TMT2-18-3]
MGGTQELANHLSIETNLRATARVGRGVKFRSNPKLDEFGPVVYSFTPADAVADGTFVRLPKPLAAEVLYDLPVVLTRAAYEDAVLWERGLNETEDTRGYDVLWMAKRQALNALNAPGERFPYTMHRIENRTSDGRISTSLSWERICLHVVAQPYNRSGDPCITILLPNED